MKAAHFPFDTAARAALATIALAALLLQFYLSIALAFSNGHGVAHATAMFLGYFTILTNLFVALAATLPLLAAHRGAGRFFARPTVLGCAVTSIVMVGAGYHLLLRDIWNPQGLQRVADYLLHYAVPLSALAYWLVFAPRVQLGLAAPVRWCIYPIAYLAYALLRGAATGWYPYYFIDVGRIGQAQVLLNVALMLLAFITVGAFIRWLPRLRRDTITAAGR